MRIFLATPASPPICTLNYVEALLPLVFTLRDAKIEMEASWLGNQSGIGHARNKLAGWFLESKADKLLFIDADIGAPAHAVVAMVRADVELVGAVCPKKVIDWEASARVANTIAPVRGVQLELASRRRALQEERGAENITRNGVNLTRVRAVGAGCMLIDRAAFTRLEREELGAPYVDRSETGGGKRYHDFFAAGADFQERDDAGAPPAEELEYVSEDYAFCRKLRDAGGVIYALVGPEGEGFTHAGFHTFGG